MQTLFTISILCFLGILWAALALARRIKTNQIRSQAFLLAQHDFKDHFLSALPDASIQIEPMPTGSRSITPQPAHPPEEIIPVFRSSAEPAPVVLRARLNGLNQSVHDIAANKQMILPTHPSRIRFLPVQRIGRPQQTAEAAQPLLSTRKPPQAATRSGVLHRLDPAYFNKDLGDLTDPYQPPPRLGVNERRRRN